MQNDNGFFETDNAGVFSFDSFFSDLRMRFYPSLFV